MEKNNNEVIEGQVTEVAENQQTEEKKSFAQKIGEAAGNFSEKHPKITKAISTTLKVGAGVGIGVLAAVISSKRKASGAEDGTLEYVDLDEIEPFDEDVIEALDTTDNDNN